jgi:hypothetical protein
MYPKHGREGAKSAVPDHVSITRLDTVAGTVMFVPTRFWFPVKFAQMCVCCNNTIGARRQMFDLCAVMDVNGDVFAAESGAKVLRAANENQDDTLASILLSTRKSLDMATRVHVDRLAQAVCEAITVTKSNFLFLVSPFSYSANVDKSLCLSFVS